MPEFDRGMMRRPQTTPYGGFGEVFGGQMGSTPRAQNEYMNQMPQLNPQGWSRSPSNPHSFPLPVNPQSMAMNEDAQKQQMGMAMLAGQAGGGQGPVMSQPGVPTVGDDWTSGQGDSMNLPGDLGDMFGPGGGTFGGGAPYRPPDFNMPSLPNVPWQQGPRRIQIGDISVDLGDPVELQKAMLGAYGQQAAVAAQVYGQQLQYKQSMAQLGMEYPYRYKALEQQGALSREQMENQRLMQEYGITQPHKQRQEIMSGMGDFIAGLGGGTQNVMGNMFGGGGGAATAPTSQLGGGMFERALQGRIGAMEAGNAAGTEQQRQGMVAQATGPGGGGMANANAAMGARLQHGNMMADVQNKQNLRQQAMAEQQLGTGRMGAVGGLMQAMRG